MVNFVYFLLLESQQLVSLFFKFIKEKYVSVPTDTKPKVKPVKSKKVNLENGEQCLHCFKMVPNLVLQPCGHKLICPDCNYFQLTKEHCMKLCTKSSRCYIYYQKDEEIKQTLGDPSLSRADIFPKNKTSYMTDQFPSIEQTCMVCESSKFMMVKFNCGHEILCEDCLIDFKEMGGKKCPEPGCKKPLDQEPIVKNCGGNIITDWFDTEVKPTFCRAIPVIQHQFGVIVDDIINWFSTDAKPKLL